MAALYQARDARTASADDPRSDGSAALDAGTGSGAAHEGDRPAHVSVVKISACKRHVPPVSRCHLALYVPVALPSGAPAGTPA